MPNIKHTVHIKNVTCSRMSPLAILVRCKDAKGDTVEVWIPQSQIDDDSEVFNSHENSEGTLVISEWIATEKGLI